MFANVNFSYRANDCLLPLKATHYHFLSVTSPCFCSCGPCVARARGPPLVPSQPVFPWRPSARDKSKRGDKRNWFEKEQMGLMFSAVSLYTHKHTHTHARRFKTEPKSDPVMFIKMLLREDWARINYCQSHYPKSSGPD